MSYGTPYIATPVNPIRVGRVKQMTKQTNTTPEVKTAKKYAKTRGEHLKDLIIVALVAGLIAFVGGMQFANKQNAEVKNAVNAAQSAIAPKAEAAPVSK